jgi:hypothetical protein
MKSNVLYLWKESDNVIAVDGGLKLNALNTITFTEDELRNTAKEYRDDMLLFIA